MPAYLSGVTTLELHSEKCIGCGMCTIVCPHEVFRIDDSKARVAARDRCMECGACARNCPTEAIHVRAGVGCASGQIMRALGQQSDCCCE
jgi:NAD-dependent dihydropyrimidine dehydrogenase PreA subunit